VDNRLHKKILQKDKIISAVSGGGRRYANERNSEQGNADLKNRQGIDEILEKTFFVMAKKMFPPPSLAAHCYAIG